MASTTSTATTRPLKIVHLDCIHVRPAPTFNVPHIYTEYPTSSPADIPSRIAEADIIITTRVPLSAASLDAAVCPSLQMIAAMSIGTDNIDLAACRRRGIVVANVPAASNESVAEHAIALYFAAKRSLVACQQRLVAGAGEGWVREGTGIGFFAGGMPGTCKEDVMAIFGAGELGNRVAKIAQALNMKVIFAERKGVPAESVRGDRVEFIEACKTASVIMLTCPLNASTRGMIGTREFAVMRRDSVVVNVARGGVVVEEDLVAALKSGRITGAATDVFVDEPAGASNSVLIREVGNLDGRLTLTPHVAWYARSSRDKLNRTVADNIEAFVHGQPTNVVV
ncbi:glycerate dehydrogenase [Phlyctema vagabunda]|uniref:Glycerate dehydrogenase n=1 Tax=Phlyctema vagabunda TaxID=108571 RepID=A0ABR4PU60_9HELO